MEDVVQRSQWRIRLGRDTASGGVGYSMFRDHFHGGFNKVLSAQFSAYSSHWAFLPLRYCRQPSGLASAGTNANAWLFPNPCVDAIERQGAVCATPSLGNFR
jgi:hypothetical protein